MTSSRVPAARLVALVDYVAEQDPPAASRMLGAVRAGVTMLADHPGLGRPGAPSPVLAALGRPLPKGEATTGEPHALLSPWEGIRVCARPGGGEGGAGPRPGGGGGGHGVFVVTVGRALTRPRCARPASPKGRGKDGRATRLALPLGGDSRVGLPGRGVRERKGPARVPGGATRDAGQSAGERGPSWTCSVGAPRRHEIGSAATTHPLRRGPWTRISQ